MKKRERILSGSIGKTITFLAIPIILASFLQTVYNLTDTFWVGRLGADSVAAVSISFPIIFFLMMFVMGLSSASVILISQSFGKGNIEKTNYYASQSILWTTLLAILLTILGIIFSKNIINIFNLTAPVFSQAVSYLQISFYGIIFVFMYLMFTMILRGVGEVKIPLYLVLSTVFLNFLLDPLFIYGFGPISPSGVSGVAWATIFTQGIAGFVGLFILIRGNYGVKIVKKYLRFDFSALKKILKLGLPTAIERSLHSFGILFFTWMVSFFGTVAIASFGIGSKVIMLVMIPSFGLAMAVTTFMGQNIGAGKIDRAEEGSKFGLLWGFIILLIAGLFIFIFAENFVRFFIPNDLEVIAMAGFFVKIIAFAFAFISLHVISGGAYKAAGRTGISLLFGMIQVALLIGFSLIAFRLGYGLNGLWFAYLFSFVISGIVAFLWYLTGSWKRESIV